MPEEIGAAARSRNDGKLAAPHGDRFGDAVKEPLVLVQGELVKGDVAALAGQGVGVGRERINAAAVSELEDIGGGVGVAIEQDFAEIGGADVQEVGPVDAIFELEFGLELVT